jgi:hypothetical protein
VNPRQSTSDLRPWLPGAAAVLAIGALLLPTPAPASPAAGGRSCAKHRGTGKAKRRRCRARASKQPTSAEVAGLPAIAAPAPAIAGAPVPIAPAPAASNPAAPAPAPGLPAEPSSEPPPTAPPAIPPGPPLEEEGEAESFDFAPNSIWSEPLGPAIVPDTESPSLVSALLARIAAERAAGTGPRLGTETRTPLYRVGPEQPRVPVYLDTGRWGDRLGERFRAGVPIPAGARPVAGSDRAMAVWQPSTDTYWEFFKMQEALHAPQFSRGAEATSGCALSGGTYVYVVTSLNSSGETTADTKGTVARVGEGGCATIRWSAVAGASGYRIYRGASTAQVSYLATVPGDAVSFEDEGLTLPEGGPPPSANTAVTPGEWHAAYGGVIFGASESPGYYRDRTSASGEVLEQSNWGSAATGLPLASGLITKTDIERGHIDHAVAIGLDDSGSDAILRAGEFAFPAQRTDGQSHAADSIPEGARLFLDPSLDLDSLDLPPLARMLAEAAQQYGLIIQDGSMATVVYAEDPAPYVRAGQPNFYRPLIGSSSLRALGEFPWQDLEVADMHLCTTRPCLPA